MITFIQVKKSGASKKRRRPSSEMDESGRDLEDSLKGWRKQQSRKARVNTREEEQPWPGWTERGENGNNASATLVENVGMDGGVCHCLHGTGYSSRRAYSHVRGKLG